MAHLFVRGMAARANFLAADRPDIIFAAKEICRFMAKPTNVALSAMKRLGRYLKGHPRLVFKFDRQEADMVNVYSDTDWAGCPRTCKSSSKRGRLRKSAWPSAAARPSITAWSGPVGLAWDNRRFSEMLVSDWAYGCGRTARPP